MSSVYSRLSPIALVVASALSSFPVVSFAEENELAGIESISIIGSRLHTSTNSQLVDIKDSNYQSLTETLEEASSIQVNSNAGPGSINELYLRGADSNYGLVLFNGIPLNDGTNSRGGVADLSSLSSLVVDRIEISHGAKSSIYGSQAISGVINFISEKNKTSEHVFEVNAGIDAEGGHVTQFAVDTSDVSLSLMSKKAPQVYGGSSLDSKSAVAVYQPQLSSGNLNVTFLASDADSTSFPDNSGGAQYAVNRSLEQRNKSDVNLGVTYQTQMMDYDLTLQGYTQNLTEDIDTPFVVPQEFSPASKSNNELKRNNITAYLSREFEFADVVVGMSYSDETGASEGEMDLGFAMPTGFELSRTTTSLFAETDVQLSEKLKLSIAGRYDDADSQSVFTPSTQLFWTLSETQNLSFEWGQGFKLPSFYALSSPLVGDPNLKSEEADTFQINYAQTVYAGEFTVSVFQYDFTNLIDFDFATFKLVNRSQASTEGAEISFKSDRSSSGWAWQASYAYTDATTGDGVEMVGRAKNKTNVRLNKTFSELDLNISSSISYRSGVWGESMATGRVQLDDQIEVNLTADWQFTQQLGLAAGIKNLNGDKLEYTPGNVHSGVMPWLSISYKF